MSTPFLSLVGAGPGDPDLITVKAIKCLRKAKVILYDALANEDLLQYASPGTIKKFVGKRYGCHALSQDEINRLILEYAFSHGRVVRLKGGDPFVFGRAQEEIETARAAGIRCDHGHIFKKWQRPDSGSHYTKRHDGQRENGYRKSK